MNLRLVLFLLFCIFSSIYYILLPFLISLMGQFGITAHIIRLNSEFVYRVFFFLLHPSLLIVITIKFNLKAHDECRAVQKFLTMGMFPFTLLFSLLMTYEINHFSASSALIQLINNVFSLICQGQE